jgi:hypothetical protein
MISHPFLFTLPGHFPDAGSLVADRHMFLKQLSHLADPIEGVGRIYWPDAGGIAEENNVCGLKPPYKGPLP